MAGLFDNRKRILLPRWRNIDDESGKLILQTEKKLDSVTESLSDLFLKGKSDFQLQKNFSTALEVVNSAFSLSKEEEAKEEALFILSLKRKLPNSLNKILTIIVRETETQNPATEIEVVNPLLTNIFKEKGKRISELRKRLDAFPYNPLLWLELSRLYSIVGSINKAETAAQISLHLSDNSNRFITRSVSRFYIHKKDFEQAQRIIRSSPLFSKDPWLIAADISYSQFLNRQATSSGIGKKLIDSQSFSNSDLTELAATLGTEEYLRNSAKEGRKLFLKSLLAPNDNSFAQAESFLDDFEGKAIMMLNIPNNFEAQSIQYQREKKFDESFAKSFQWLLDQPFSRRASYFNSYLLCGQLENFEKAIEVGKFSLHSNPESFLLNNNVAYSYAQLNDVKNAKLFLKRMKKIHDIRPSEKIVLLATEGIIKYRDKQFEEGRKMYQAAITEADKQKNKVMKSLALVNFAREEFLSNSIDKEQVGKIISNLEKEDIKKDELENEISNLNKLLFREEKKG